MRKVLFLALIGVLSGCATIPSVEYAIVTKPEDMKDMSDAFYLRRSMIEISGADVKGNDRDGNDVITTSVTIKAVPKEDMTRRIAIGGRRDFTSSTKVNIIKLDNTDLVKSIGVETTDTTKSNIEQIGGVITKVISLAAMFGAAADDPCITESGGRISITPDFTAAPQIVNAGRSQCIAIEYGPVPKDAIDFNKLPIGQKTRYYYYAACRDATVKVLQKSSIVLTETVKVSDPTHLQYVQFPVKGKIDHHTVCGTSVTTETVTATSAADIVGALQVQAKAIKDALDAAGKDK